MYLLFICIHAYIHLGILGISGQQTINYNSYNMHEREKVGTADLSFMAVTRGGSRVMRTMRMHQSKLNLRNKFIFIDLQN